MRVLTAVATLALLTITNGNPTEYYPTNMDVIQEGQVVKYAKPTEAVIEVKKTKELVEQPVIEEVHTKKSVSETYEAGSYGASSNEKIIKTNTKDVIAKPATVVKSVETKSVQVQPESYGQQYGYSKPVVNAQVTNKEVLGASPTYQTQVSYVSEQAYNQRPSYVYNPEPAYSPATSYKKETSKVQVYNAEPSYVQAQVYSQAPSTSYNVAQGSSYVTPSYENGPKISSYSPPSPQSYEKKVEVKEIIEPLIVVEPIPVAVPEYKSEAYSDYSSPYGGSNLPLPAIPRLPWDQTLELFALLLESTFLYQEHIPNNFRGNAKWFIDYLRNSKQQGPSYW